MGRWESHAAACMILWPSGVCIAATFGLWTWQPRYSQCQHKIFIRHIITTTRILALELSWVPHPIATKRKPSYQKLQPFIHLGKDSEDLLHTISSWKRRFKGSRQLTHVSATSKHLPLLQRIGHTFLILILGSHWEANNQAANERWMIFTSHFGIVKLKIIRHWEFISGPISSSPQYWESYFSLSLLATVVLFFLLLLQVILSCDY